MHSPLWFGFLIVAPVPRKIEHTGGIRPLNWTNLDASRSYFIQNKKGNPADLLPALKPSVCSKTCSFGKGPEHEKV
jgi:hypothetical protein